MNLGVPGAYLDTIAKETADIDVQVGGKGTGGVSPARVPACLPASVPAGLPDWLHARPSPAPIRCRLCSAMRAMC